MPATTSPANSRAAIAALLDAAGHIVLGKQHEIRLAVACLLARGHLLIEDVPGAGKTTPRPPSR